MRKKTLVVALGVVLVAAVLVGGTLAYFTSATSATNVVAMGNVTIRATLEDEVDDQLEVVRGQSYQTNNVRIQNHGSTTAFIRVRLVPFREEEAQYYSQLEVRRMGGGSELLKYENGWYYYKEAIPPDLEEDNPLRLEGWFAVNLGTVQTALSEGVELRYEVQAVQEEYIEIGADGYPVWPDDDLIIKNYNYNKN